MQYPLNQSIWLTGWVSTIRQHKNIAFVDLRRRDDLIQLVIEKKSLLEKLKNINLEDVIKIQGQVRQRPSGMQNPKIPSGKIEIAVNQLIILAKSQPLPFELKDTRQINEEMRLKYRYLDLRSARMQKNLFARHRANQLIRNFLTKKGFWEIETPYLTKSTPEGARDYLVPSRLHQGKFYALPQSPQQYKQLLMVAGVEKYFQIVRCMRDEDQRGDRQPEFTQVDIEQSFISQDEIMQLVEQLMIELVKKNYPEFKLTKQPFPRLTYQSVMKKYQTDRPDLRKNKHDSKELSFAWIIDFPAFEWKQEEKRWGAVHHPFTAIHPDDIHLLDQQDKNKIRALQYDLVLNGEEVAGGSIRIHDAKLLMKIFNLLGHSSKEIKQKFGHLLTAFSFGVPPHGGIAIGYDRLLMILQQEKNIREVIAFPKTGDGRDPLMEAPSDLDSNQLTELGIQLIKKQKVKK